MLRCGISMLVVLFVANVATAGDAKTPPSTPATMQVATSSGSDAERSACTPDVFRLCGQFIPDVEGIVGCLKLQRTNLSPACRAVFR
jgi:hypothetical protein